MRSSAAPNLLPEAHTIPIEDRLIVPLDVPNTEQALRIVDALGDTVHFYKIGLQFIFGGGVEFVEELRKRGKRVFMDAKLNDIDHTIHHAIQNLIDRGVSFVTVYGENGRAVRRAVEARGQSTLRVFCLDAPDQSG